MSKGGATIIIDYLSGTEFERVMQAEEMFVQHVRNPAEMRYMEACELLGTWYLRADTLIAVLLVPLLRHDMVAYTQLVECFGEGAVQLGRAACRLMYEDATPTNGKPRKHHPRNTAMEKLRQLFISTYTMTEAVLICMAVHINSARQLDSMTNDEQYLWAQKTREIYLPVLELLGMWKYREELSNHCLYIIEPDLYRQLSERTFAYYKHHEQRFSKIRNNLYDLFDSKNLYKAQITLYDMTETSLYNRMQKAQLHNAPAILSNVEKLTVDILVPTQQDCYQMLGIIHDIWQPAHYASNVIDERFVDRIAAPEYNGYRALTTVVMHNDDDRHHHLIKFRIRTHEMERINQEGVVAAIADDVEVKNAWWSNAALIETIKSGSPDGDIFIFTPTGEAIYPLRRRSTVVDLAFKIHSQLGPYARQFWVNGQPVPHHTRLNSGDLVKTEYDHKYPSLKPEWEEFAQTSTARSNIRRFLKRQEQSPHRGRKLIDEVLSRETDIYEMRFPQEKIDKALEKIARRLHMPTVQTLYIKVQEGRIAPDSIVATLIEDELVDYIVLEETNSRPTTPIQLSRGWMQEKTSRKWEKTSRVMPGVAIAGRYVGKGKKARLVVYRQDAPNAPVGDEAIALRWRTTKDIREAVEIDIIAQPQSHIIGMVLNAIYNVSKDDEKQSLNIHRFHSDMQEMACAIKMVVDAPTFDGLYKLQDALMTIQRGGYIVDFKVWKLFPGQKQMLAGKRDKRQRNPYTLSKISERTMFFGRDDEMTRIMDHINNEEMFIILSGQKRIGKSSLLHHLCEYFLPEMCDVIPVAVDAHSVIPFEPKDFLLQIAEKTHDQISRHIKERKGLRLKPRDLGENPFIAFAQWVKQVEQHLRGKRLLFVIDEFTTAEEKFQEGRLDGSFFDGMQWLAGTQRIGFLLCVHDHIFKETSRSWGLLQRGQPLRLSILDRKSARRLVQQPLERIYKYEPGVVEEILNLTNCHPYFVHILCQEVITNVTGREGDTVTFADLNIATKTMIINGRHYFNHLLNHQDTLSYDTLRFISRICDEETPWVSRDEIQAVMKKNGYGYDGKVISKLIGDLNRATILESKIHNQQAVYRIQIGIFYRWLREKATHILVDVDIRRED